MPIRGCVFQNESFLQQQRFGTVSLWIFLVLRRGLFADEHQGHDEREVDKGELEQLPRGGAVCFLVEPEVKTLVS